MIPDDRWSRVEELFAAALDVEPEDRDRFLAAECAGDTALRAEIESLLAASSKADGVFEPRDPVMKPLAAALRSELLLGCDVGHYHIEAPLGEGGMGIVYRATDTRSGRPVALKVLPPEMVDNPGRRHRFALEARAASALNHPGIVKVIEIGCSEFGDFIAMECVDGWPLQSLLGRPLPLRDALSFANQIASALEVAHAGGIVHRDIKPANVLVTITGAVKVADFGLCKLTEPESSQSDSGHSWTREGTIVGSTAYMSPEQAEGKPADCRSDIFSLGSVLYEMVTGERPFQGDTQISTLASILRSAPRPVCDVVPNIPPAVETVILRCLEKDPSRRYQSAADMRVALENLCSRLDAGKLRRPLIPRKYRITVQTAAAVCLIVPFAVWFLWRGREARIGGAPVQVTFDTGLTTDPALSPDGQLLAYASDRAGPNLSIWLQRAPMGKPVRLTLDDAEHSEPSISPDGSVVAFRAEHDGGGIYSVPAAGGRETLIAKGGRRPRFSPDGKWIAYWVGAEGSGDPDAAGASQVFVVSKHGGVTHQIQPGFLSARSPVWFPDSKYVLFVGARDSARTTPGVSSWWAAPLDGGSPIETAPADAFRQAWVRDVLTPSAWAPGNYAIAASDLNQLWRVAVSPKSRKIVGTPERINSGLDAQVSPSLSLAGRMAFSSASARTAVWTLPMVTESARSQAAPVRIAGAPGVQAVLPALSLDGRRLCYSTSARDGMVLWKDPLDKVRREPVVLTNGSNWSTFLSDGLNVAYVGVSSGHPSLFVAPWDGGAPRMIADRVERVWDISPDGKSVLDFSDSVQPRPVVLVDVKTGARRELLRHPQWNLYLAHFSPDGHWIAFGAKTGPDRSRIFIAPFSGSVPVAESRWIPVTDGASEDSHAWWSPEGTRLYFFSERDGHRCLVTQLLDSATKRCSGPAAPVYHFHSAALSPANVDRGFLSLSVARDKIALTLGEKTGNIWLK